MTNTNTRCCSASIVTFEQICVYRIACWFIIDFWHAYTAWKVSKYGVFLVCIFAHSDWIRRDTEYLSIFNPNAGKYRPDKTPHLDTFHTVLRLLTLSRGVERTLSYIYDETLILAKCSIIDIWKVLHKKWSFSLRISSVNVAGNCGFGHIYWRNP